MQFHQVKYFLSATETLNFTRAAEVCNVSQPALTVAIGKLESELGAKLFKREGRLLHLTEFGKAMRGHLGKIEQTRNAAKEAAADYIREDTALIDLGMMCTVGPDQLFNSISDWQRHNPSVELLLHDVWESRVQDMLLAGAIDCALLATTEPLPDRFDTVCLVREPMVLAMATDHPLSIKPTIVLNDLAGLAYVDRLRCEFRTVFTSELRNRDIELTTVMRSEREDWIINAVARGVGVSIMPQHAATSAGLVSRRVEDLAVTRSVELATVANRTYSAAVNSFVDSVKCSWDTATA